MPWHSWVGSPAGTFPSPHVPGGFEGQQEVAGAAVAMGPVAAVAAGPVAVPSPQAAARIPAQEAAVPSPRRGPPSATKY